MDFVFDDKDYNRKVCEEWEHFIDNKPVNEKNIRPEIYRSWQRCKAKGVDWEHIVPQLLPHDEFLKRLSENELMCKVALPFMERIYHIIKGSESMVSLADKDGIFLTVMQDEVLNEYAKKNLYIEGANQSEDIVGTNEVSLCLKMQKPVWCWGAENYCMAGKEWACVAAPIFGGDGELIGVISVSNKMQRAHRHTAGMVIASAKAIENEMRLQKAYNNLIITANQLSATIETTPQGMIVVDNTGLINNINSFAKRILYLENQDVIGKHVGTVLVDKNNSFSHFPVRSMPEQEIVFRTSFGEHRYYIGSKIFSTVRSGEPEWMLITLKEMENVRKFANKLTSSYSQYNFSDIIGKSAVIKETIELAKITANSSSTVLIIGESGTGKELFAQAIHGASVRKDEPFISLNCAALPSGLVESELFGYEGGAFTGARKEGHIGKFELAHKGTIFLDEIGDMPLSVQASILRTIQTKEVTRIGGNKINNVDVRIIAATHKDLKKGVEENSFREDLFYRINVLQITIPPLRNRKEDIPLLADFFLDQYKQRMGKYDLLIDDSAYDLLQNHNWPGNVRELENVIERVVNFCETPVIRAENIKRHILTVPSTINQEKQEPPLTAMETNIDNADPSLTKIKDIEKDLIIKFLLENNGNIAKSADALGIGRRTLYRKCELYNIDYSAMRR